MILAIIRLQALSLLFQVGKFPRNLVIAMVNQEQGEPSLGMVVELY